MNNPPLWTRNYISVCISNFSLFLTFYFLLVTLPVYAMKHLDFEAAQVGLIVTVFLIAAILIRPFAGIWIERFGNKLVLLFSLGIFSAATAGYFFTDTIMIMLILRFFHGLGFGIATTAVGTIVANVIPASRRGEAMGYYAMGMNLAMVIGPFVGLTALQQWSPSIMFSIALACSLSSIVIALFIEFPKADVKPRQKQAFSLGNLFEPSALKIAIVGGYFALVYSSIISFISVYAEAIGLVEAASYFFMVFAIVLLLSRPFTGRWFDKYGANVIINPSIILFAIGMLVLSQAENAVVFLLAAAFIGLGWGTLFPSFQTIAISDAPPQRRGLATATFLSVFDFGIGLGSFLVGLAAEAAGFRSLYFYSSILVIAGLPLYYFLNQRNRSKRWAHEGLQ